MVIDCKARFPLFLFLSTLFLAFSVSFTVGQDREQQCQQQCKDFKRPALHSGCMTQCRMMGPWGWGSPPVGDEKLPYDPSYDQECQQQCERMRGGRSQQQQCQRQCKQQQQLQQCRQQCQQTMQSPEICQKICQQKSEGGQEWKLEIVSNHHEQQQEQQQCQQRCQSQRGQKQQQQCQQECQQEMRQMKQKEREQLQEMCQQSCEMQGSRGGQQQQQRLQCRRQCEQQAEQQQRQLEQCKQQCQMQGQQPQQCHRTCMQQIEEQQQQGQQGQRGQQGQQGQQESQFEQCQQRCQKQGHGQQQQQCQRTCREELEKQQERQQQGGGQGGRGGNKVEDFDDAVNGEIRERYEQCMQSCERQQQGQGEQEQCPRQCKQQFEQEKKQYQQCKQRCEKSPQKDDEKHQCKLQCKQQRGQQGGGNDVDEDDGLNGTGYGGAKQRYEQCKQSCQSQQQGQGQQQQCPEQCKQRFEQEKQQYKQCKQSCQYGGQDKQQCRQQCTQQAQQQGGGNEVEDDALNGYEGAKAHYQQCKQSCQSQQQGQGQQEQCSRQCKKQFEQEKEEFKKCKRSCEKQARDADQKEQCKQQCTQQAEQQRGSSRGGGGQNPQGQTEGQETQMGGRGQGQSISQSNNPFYFPSNRFQPRFQSNEGGLFVLERFTKKQGGVLRGIGNYRLAIFEAKPNTFVLPHHCDAEAIYVVLNGECTCAILMKDQKESNNMQHGDVIRVPAGATTYLINNNNDETLRIAKLIQPVNSPGRFEEFFPAGSGNPESYFSVFSNDILESAFDTPREKLEQGFKRQQGQGIVVKAPREQLEALSQSSSRRRGSRQSQGPFNLRQQNPVHSNNYGQLFEACPEKFDQLRDMDVSVSCLELNQQATMVPHYNSKATYLLMVVEGNGRVEMACPHMASQSQQITEQQEEQQEQSGRYMKVTAQLSPGDAFVLPAGHPVAFVAENQNLRILGFGLNAQNNMRNFLAGQEDNIMTQMDREARQLLFGQEMEQIFSKQQKSYFVPTQKGRSRNHPLSSILEFAGMI